ncbi:MAG: VTT domain-containing protein [Micropruina sp.]|uniref:DedA family protein n=1 Tax=Micropruina sp. TaxID=2737536 RepID=UPI0039E2B3B1
MDPTQWDAPFPLIVATLFCIVLTRSNATYWAGRLVARGAHRTRAARWMDSSGYRKAVDRLNRWGAPAVSLSFLTVGVQTLINLAAGAARMPLTRYIPATVVGSIAWAFLYGTVGFVGWEALVLLWEHSPVAAVAAGLAAVAGLVWFIVRQLRRSQLVDDLETGTDD